MSESEQPDADSNPYAPPAAETKSPLPAQLSVPLALVLLCVLVGSFFISISLGIGLVLIAIPAYARAVNLSRRRIAAGQATSTFDRFIGFLGSVAVVIVCALAGCGAFYVTCAGGFVTGTMDGSGQLKENA